MVSPQVDPQCGQTYSYLSPSGRINSRRLRTLTARLHLGHASRLASKRSKAGLRFSVIALCSQPKSCHQLRLPATSSAAILCRKENLAQHDGRLESVRCQPADSPARCASLHQRKDSGKSRRYLFLDQTSCPSPPSSLCVVKDDSQAEAITRLYPAHAVPDVDAI